MDEDRQDPQWYEFVVEELLQLVRLPRPGLDPHPEDTAYGSVAGMIWPAPERVAVYVDDIMMGIAGPGDTGYTFVFSSAPDIILERSVYGTQQRPLNRYRVVSLPPSEDAHCSGSIAITQYPGTSTSASGNVYDVGIDGVRRLESTITDLVIQKIRNGAGGHGTSITVDFHNVWIEGLHLPDGNLVYSSWGG